MLSSLWEVAVWSDLILNFEGIVAGIELSAKTELEKSGRIVAFCDWKLKLCDQKICCSRDFAPKTPKRGASWRPDEHSSRPGSENKKIETAFDRPIGHAKESDLILVSCW